MLVDKADKAMYTAKKKWQEQGGRIEIIKWR